MPGTVKTARLRDDRSYRGSVALPGMEATVKEKGYVTSVEPRIALDETTFAIRRGQVTKVCRVQRGKKVRHDARGPRPGCGRCGRRAARRHLVCEAAAFAEPCRAVVRGRAAVPAAPPRNHLLWQGNSPCLTSGEPMRSSCKPDWRRYPAEGLAAAAPLVGGWLLRMRDA